MNKTNLLGRIELVMINYLKDMTKLYKGGENKFCWYRYCRLQNELRTAATAPHTAH